MGKHSKSSSSSRSKSSGSSRSKNSGSSRSKSSITSGCSAKSDFDCLCQNITPIDRSNNRRKKKRRIDHQVGCDKLLAKVAKNTEPINEKDIHMFLEHRKSNLDRLEEIEIDDTPIDCINITDGNLIIDKSIVNDETITISKYIYNGSYGVVFVNSENTFVIKFIRNTSANSTEIKIMLDIRKKNKENQIPNFINIYYFRLNCIKITNTQEQDNNIVKALENCLVIDHNKSGKYSVIILEYFDGTILNLLNPILHNSTLNPENIELFSSIFAQALLSLLILHNKFKYYHKDAHLNNFFYKKVIPDNKYFHYKINETNYYIKNCGYLIVLADYGITEEINDIDIAKIFKDYSNLLCYINSLCLFKYNELYANAAYYKKKFTNFMKFANGIEASSISVGDFIKSLLTYFFQIKTSLGSGETKINEVPYECNY